MTRHGWRARAIIVVLWRAGLRNQEALALAEHDLDHRRGSILVRHGEGGRPRGRDGRASVPVNAAGDARESHRAEAVAGVTSLLGTVF
jgi:integrase